MPMIGPMPPAPEPPAAPTPWNFDVWNHAVRDAHGHYLFEINGEDLGPGENADLARELVDLVNRAAAAVDPVTRPAERKAQAYPETSTVCLPATVETHDGLVWFEVHRQSPPGFAEIRVITGFGETREVFDPASARALAYALLAAAGPERVEVGDTFDGSTEPDVPVGTILRDNEGDQVKYLGDGCWTYVLVGGVVDHGRGAWCWQSGDAADFSPYTVVSLPSR